MTYYRAKIDVRRINRMNREWTFFIINELVTPKEFEKRVGFSMEEAPAYVRTKFDKIRICPKNTYFFFGVRFADEERIIETTPV